MRTRSFIALLALVTAPYPSFAQEAVSAENAPAAGVQSSGPQSGPDVPQDTAPKIDLLAAQAIHNFARCVVETTRSGAAKLLTKDFRTAEYQEDIRKFAKGHDRCAANSKIGFSGLVFAGNLAEHLLSAQFTVAQLSTDLSKDRTTDPILARSTTEAIAMCIAMRASSETAALFRTEVMSDEEKDAMKVLTPYLSACVPKGTQLRTNRIGLRALLALAAYRIAVTSKQGAAA